MGKIDIKSAFRLLIVNPADFDLLGIEFQGLYYVEKNLPMGLAQSCNLFEKFARFLQWVVEFRSGLHSVDHYLDDFIFMGSEHSDDCAKLMENFFHLSYDLGVPIAEDKTVGPTTIMPFLGLVINKELGIISIPHDKLFKLQSQLLPMLYKKKILIKDLESVTGLLSFCCRAIPSARAFIRRFYDLMAGLRNKKPYFRVRLNAEVKADVVILLEFLEKFNGHCFFPERLWVTNLA